MSVGDNFEIDEQFDKEYEELVKREHKKLRKEKRVEKVSKLFSRLRTTAVIAPVLIGPIVGVYIGQHNAKVEEEKIEDAREQMGLQSKWLKNSRNREMQVQTSIGLLCSRALSLMIGDGILADTPTLENIKLLLNSPNKLCGETALEVAQNMQDLSDADQEVEEYSEGLTDAQNDYYDLLQTRKSLFESASMGFVLGGGAGVVLTTAAGLYVDRRYGSGQQQVEQ